VHSGIIPKVARRQRLQVHVRTVKLSDAFGGKGRAATLMIGKRRFVDEVRGSYHSTKGYVRR